MNTSVQTKVQTTAIDELSAELLEIYGQAPQDEAELVVWLKDWLYMEMHDHLDPRNAFSPVRWDLVGVVYTLLPDDTVVELKATFKEKSTSFFSAIDDNTAAYEGVMDFHWRGGSEVAHNDRVETYFKNAGFPLWAQTEAFTYFGD